MRFILSILFWSTGTLFLLLLKFLIVHVRNVFSWALLGSLCSLEVCLLFCLRPFVDALLKACECFFFSFLLLFYFSRSLFLFVFCFCSVSSLSAASLPQFPRSCGCNCCFKVYVPYNLFSFRSFVSFRFFESRRCCFSSFVHRVGESFLFLAWHPCFAWSHFARVCRHRPLVSPAF